VAIIPDTDPDAPHDGAFLKSLEPLATVTLREGLPVVQDLTIK
jgi:hypothetical protein